jgi:hypothetical protein
MSVRMDLKFVADLPAQYAKQIGMTGTEIFLSTATRDIARKLKQGTMLN